MEKMDQMVEEAMRLNVKWSLMELSRAFYGDGKSMLDPIFKVKVVLEDGIEFSPCMEEVSGFITAVSGDLINAISVFHRLPEILTRKSKSVREVYVNGISVAWL